MPEDRPTASIENLRRRDAVIRRIRNFFESRDFPARRNAAVVSRHRD